MILSNSWRFYLVVLSTSIYHFLRFERMYNEFGMFFSNRRFGIRIFAPKAVPTETGFSFKVIEILIIFIYLLFASFIYIKKSSGSSNYFDSFGFQLCGRWITYSFDSSLVYHAKCKSNDSYTYWDRKSCSKHFHARSRV